MNKVAIIISPNYKDYAAKHLKDCIESLKRQSWAGEKRIFIIDNQSTAASFEFLKDTAAEAEIIRNKNNEGFAIASNSAMRIALEAGFDYILLLNMDTIAEPDCISSMVSVAESDGSIGAVQARLMLWPEKDRVNSLGNVTHFLGLGYCDGYGDLWSNDLSFSVTDICFPSGACALYKREVLEKIGIFDEVLWIYNEDQDLGWRIWLNGFRCVLAAQAVVYHKYDFSGNARKYYFIDRNRIILMIKNYQITTLLLISPAFVFMEFGLLLFAFQKGWFKEKLRVYLYFLRLKNIKHLIKERRRSQMLRRVKDREIIGMFSGRIWYDEVGDRKLFFANKTLNRYWCIVKWIMKAKD